MHGFAGATNIAPDLAAVFNIVGWLLYLHALAKRKIRSSPANWIASMLLVCSAFISESNMSSAHAAVSYLCGALACVAAIALSMRDAAPASREDFLLIGLGMALVVASRYAPSMVAVMASAYYLLNYASFAQRVWRGHSIENPLPWAIWMLGAASMLIGLAHQKQTSLILPSTNLLCWSAIFVISLMRQGTP